MTEKLYQITVAIDVFAKSQEDAVSTLENTLRPISKFDSVYVHDVEERDVGPPRLSHECKHGYETAHCAVCRP